MLAQNLCELSLSPSRLIYRGEQPTQAQQVEKKETVAPKSPEDQARDKRATEVKDKYGDDSFLDDDHKLTVKDGEIQGDLMGVM